MAGCQKSRFKRNSLIIRNYTPDEMLLVALIENVQREDLNTIEEASAYFHLIKQLSITHEQLSDRIGKSRTAITNKMRLLKLPADIQMDVVIGTLSEGHARAILQLEEEPEKMLTLKNKIIKDNLNVRQTEAIAKKWLKLSLDDILSGEDKNSQHIQRKNSEIVNMEERLSSVFGTKVTIEDKNNKGKIIIDYYSLEDFERILESIKS